MGDVTKTLRHPREATDIVKTFVHRRKQANKQTKKNIYRKCIHILTLKAYTYHWGH
jgi:uncharacterized membrane protein